MATLNGAIAAVDLEALDAHDQAKFDASLKAAHAKAGSAGAAAADGDVPSDGNSHIDAAWLWPWTETVDVVKRTFGTALQLMYEYPRIHLHADRPRHYNEWMAQKYPDMNAEIAQRIKEGRWEIVGGMWVEPDLNMPDGEIAGAAVAGGQALVQAGLRRGRADRLESGFVWIHVAVAADL